MIKIGYNLLNMMLYQVIKTKTQQTKILFTGLKKQLTINN